MAVAERKLVEVKPPEQVQFTTEGQQLSGYLLKFQKTTVKDKPANEFVLQIEGTRQLATFLGTWDLEKRIGQLVREHGWGCFVVITYVGEDHEIKTQGNAIKRFRVEVDPSDRYRTRSAAAASAQANPEITDDDIPF
jgi:hypothetical protein